MASDDASQLLILAVLLIGSAFFSSAETAMTAVNRIRLQTLADEGNRRAKTALQVTEKRSRLLSTLLIGNNLVNNLLSALTTALAIRLVGNGSIGIATAIITVLILIFGEITPKTLASAYPEKVALAYASIILAMTRVMTPVIFVINSVCKLLLRPFHVNLDGSLNTMTEMELRTIVDVSHKDGVIEKEEREMIYNVVDFGDSAAKDVMVPRTDIVMISEDASYEEVRSLFREEKYTRIPVYREDQANIIGILNIKDFFFCDNIDTFCIKDIMYEPYFTYEYKKTSELLIEMRKNSVSIAIVLDEYGGSVGMIALEDLLEEIVGEIRDEYDADEENQIRQISELEYQIEGSVRLDDINDALGLKLTADDYDSIGGLIIEKLEHLPTEQESIVTEDGIRLTVLKMLRNKIELVQLTLPKPGEKPKGSASQDSESV